MVLHTRLTHSAKVSQLAQAIAEDLLRQDANHPTILTLGGLDAEVAQAASLCHDLGHPPFGHIGEEVLDKLAREELGLPNGFEGNAQSFRIITKLEKRSTRYDGLDLTRATLAGTAKYPWTRTPTRATALHEQGLGDDHEYRKHWRKFSAYNSELDELQQCRSFLPSEIGQEVQSLEASIMDVADDITYAVHDLEDFFLAGILDVRAILAQLDGSHDGLRAADRPEQSTCFTRLAERLSTDYPDYFNSKTYDSALDSVSNLLRVWLGTSDYRGEPFYERKARQHLSSAIERFTGAIVIAAEPLWQGGPHIGLEPDQWHEVQILKEVTREFIIQRSDIALLQHGQQEVLKDLVRLLRSWVKDDFKRLPPPLREEIEIVRGLASGDLKVGYDVGEHPKRGSEDQALIDYICTFTDAGCLSLHETLTGRRIPRIGSGL